MTCWPAAGRQVRLIVWCIAWGLDAVANHQCVSPPSLSLVHFPPSRLVRPWILHYPSAHIPHTNAGLLDDALTSGSGRLASLIEVNVDAADVEGNTALHYAGTQPPLDLEFILPVFRILGVVWLGEIEAMLRPPNCQLPLTIHPISRHSTPAPFLPPQHDLRC